MTRKFAIGAILISLVIAGCAAPAAQESQAPSTTDAAASTVSATSTEPTPSLAARPVAVDPVFLRVLVDGLRIRREPDVASPELSQLRAGDIVAAAPSEEVISGGRQWYPVRHGPFDGWAAAGSSTDPWLGEPVSAAEAEVVVRVDYDIDVSNLMGRNKLILFADGRLVVPHETSGVGWSERWLTRAGVDHLRAEVLATGLFVEDTFFAPAQPEYVAVTSVAVTTENGLVTASVNQPAETAEADLLLALADRLLRYSTWLAAAMFVDADARPQRYVTPQYLFTVTFSPDQPPDIAESQRGRGEIDSIELPPEIELVDGGCSVIDAATFTTLRQVMSEAGFGPDSSTDAGGGWWVGWAAGNGAVLLDVTAVPPGVQADCMLRNSY